MNSNGITDDYEKTGYLKEHCRIFHLKDSLSRTFSYHYHDFDKIICFLGGKTDYMIEGKKYSLEPYDFVIINRNEIHKPIVDFSIPYERIILYIDHEFLQKYRQEEYDLTGCFTKTKESQFHVVRFPASVTGQMYEILGKMEENEKGNGYAGELYGEILFLEFMIQINRACLENEYAFHPTVKYNKKIIDIIRFINGNLSGDLSIEGLSEHFFISKYHMMRQFREETGFSIHQYILEKRVLAAKNMIQEGMPAAVAALECGFGDYSAFAKAFKKKAGVLPSEIK